MPRLTVSAGAVRKSWLMAAFWPQDKASSAQAGQAPSDAAKAGGIISAPQSKNAHTRFMILTPYTENIRYLYQRIDAAQREKVFHCKNSVAITDWVLPHSLRLALLQAALIPIPTRPPLCHAGAQGETASLDNLPGSV